MLIQVTRDENINCDEGGCVQITEQVKLQNTFSEIYEMKDQNSKGGDFTLQNVNL